MEKIHQAVLEGDKDTTVELVKVALDSGRDASDILQNVL